MRKGRERENRKKLRQTFRDEGGCRERELLGRRVDGTDYCMMYTFVDIAQKTPIPCELMCQKCKLNNKK
jgi:hypothetical protein